jgi:phospholipase C
VFDHTSLIRFIERRFAPGRPALIESNITAWRRTVCGDLTSAFDFERPNHRLVKLPDTAAYEPPDRDRHPDYVPTPADPAGATASGAGAPARARPAVRAGCRGRRGHDPRRLPHRLHQHGEGRGVLPGLFG